jgi:hypothetical protein
MKPTLFALLLIGALAFAQDEAEDKPEEAPDAPDPVKLLADLTAANEAKDATKIGLLLKDIGEFGRSAKEAADVDPLAAELVKSLKACKGNQGTLIRVLETLGELRSKEAASALKKIAFRKKAKSLEEEAYQATAILALCKLRDKKYINGLGDISRHKSTMVAKAAYEGFAEYGTCSGKIRKGIAELLMKRLDMEYPAASRQGDGGKVSGEQKKRWDALSPVIIKTMQSICRQPTINDIENWREWWKEFKKDRRTWKDEKKT